MGRAGLLPLRLPALSGGAKMVQLSERAAERIRIAVRLLRGDPVFFGLPKKWNLDDSGGFFVAALSVINNLPPDKRKELKDFCDWVEDYQNTSS